MWEDCARGGLAHPSRGGTSSSAGSRLGPLHRRGVGRGSPGGVDSSGWTLQRDGWLRGVTEAAGGSSQTVQMDGWPGRMALTREHPLLGGGRHPTQNVESADS